MDGNWNPRLNEEFLKDSYKPVFRPFKGSKEPQTAKKKHAAVVKLEKISDSGSLDVLWSVFICSVLLTLQYALALGSYSGEKSPPMNGDFEAQRHWMEITYHLPMNQWYVNGSDNDLLYWGLDYPPLTAYHSWAMGGVAHIINPSWVALHTSRGIETPQHKLFMRVSAILPYIFIYLPALVLFWVTSTTKVANKTVLFGISMIYAGLLAIDCAHFQYNSISLGLFIFAYVGLVQGFTLLGSVSFVLAVNYKQMELYHALPIFVFILARSLRRPFFERLVDSVRSLLCVASVVLSTFVIIWAPFLSQGFDHVLIVLRRLFPFYRGLYEDKVASVWCAFSFVLKLNRFFDLDTQIKLSTVCVLVSCLPSLLILLVRPTPRNFRLSLLVTSLCFFLFSFQVHEKSILLPAIAALLLLPEHPEAITWLLHISNTSMYSLCLKDGNHSLLCLFAAYYIACSALVPRSSTKSSVLYHSSSLGALVICVMEWSLTPPAHLPHIFPQLNAVYSCVHFILFLAYFYYQMATEEYAKLTKKNV